MLRNSGTRRKVRLSRQIEVSSTGAGEGARGGPPIGCERPRVWALLLLQDSLEGWDGFGGPPLMCFGSLDNRLKDSRSDIFAER